jgi:predicted ATPase
VLFGLWRFYLHRGQLQTAHEFAEQALSLAQNVPDPLPLLEAHQELGVTLYYRGELAVARVHLEASLDLYAPAQQHGGGLLYIGQGHIARVLWLLGYSDQALWWSRDALTLAQQIARPFGMAFALSLAAVFHQFRREERCTQERAEATISIATDQGFPYWMAVGSLMRGWALAQQGQAKEGIEQITQGLMTYRATGAELWRPYFLALLAEAHGTLGEPEEGLTVLTEALTLTETTGGRWCEPELYRLQGELLLQCSSDNQGEAEIGFYHAMTIARSQQAKSFELRAATSLARLWQQQGKRQEAHDLLASVYNWFTEGFDTADLKDAKALLDELA